MGFEEVWERIKKETGLRRITELAELADTSQPNVSKKKKENVFPADWAFRVAQKYGLSTDWIMTGYGSPRPDQSSHGLDIINKIGQWIEGQEKSEPGALAWFTYDFRKKYPEFDRWEKREKGDSAEHNAGIKSNTA